MNTTKTSEICSKIVDLENEIEFMTNRAAPGSGPDQGLHHSDFDYILKMQDHIIGPYPDGEQGAIGS